ncbi:MAG: hypothetical protein H7Z42_00905 [Roseiflexaceae bacterium]|nr:hypothetical protein [Roseiflexaceae bacterium]
MDTVIRMVVGLAIVFVTFGSSAVPTAAAQTGERCFEQTSQCIGGRFRSFWEQNGGLAVFGYPLSAAAEQPSRDTGQNYVTQQFERARFELHPENTAPYDVLLGRIGADVLANRGDDWPSRPTFEQAPAGCLLFRETGHTLCNSAVIVNNTVIETNFRSYWESQGLFDQALNRYGRSLALSGLPLTDTIIETNSSGDLVVAQYFERARLERKLEPFGDQSNPTGPVLQGRLGDDLLATKRTIKPVELNLDTPTALLADEQGLVLVTGDQGSTIFTGAASGSQVRPIASDQPFVGSIAADKQYVYYTTSDYRQNSASEIRRVSRASGNPERLATVPPSAQGRPAEVQPFGLVLGAEDLYWSNNLGQILRLPKSGGEPQVIAEQQARILALAANEAYVYWATQSGTFVRLSRASGQVEQLATQLGENQSARLILSGAEVYLALVNAEGGSLLWFSNEGILQETLATGIINNLLFSGDKLYWTNGLGSIAAVSKIGGPIETLVASQPLVAFALNSEGLFWVNNHYLTPAVVAGNASTRGSLMYVSIK